MLLVEFIWYNNLELDFVSKQGKHSHLLLMVKGGKGDHHLGSHCCWLELDWSLRVKTFYTSDQ